MAILISGKMDRLDVDGGGKTVRVTDYKTGNVPKNIDTLSIDGGRELQRCIYRLAVRLLLVGAITIDARLNYLDEEDGGIFTLASPNSTEATLFNYIDAAIDSARAGHCVIGEDTDKDYNDYLFAFPANAGGAYFPRKKDACSTVLADLAPFWIVP